MNFLKLKFNFLKIGGETSFLLNSFKRNLNYKPIETDNKITIGHKLTRVLEKNRQKAIENELASSRYKLKNASSSNLLISCSIKSKNHYAGRIYGKFSEQHHLASASWYNRIRSGEYFTINPTGAHPSLILSKQNEFTLFNDLNLNENLINLLKQNLKINKPTNIQCLAIDKFETRKTHLLLNAETGGGKTLAYLLPLIQNCIQTKQFIQNSTFKRGPNQPLAVILVPTRELAHQIKSVFDKLTQTNEKNDYLERLKNLSVVCDTSTSPATSTEIDILITQPTQLKRRLDQNKTHYESVYLKNVILDEADTLLDDSFNEIVLDCLSQLNLNLDLNDKLLSCQLAFVSATIPRDLKNILKNLINVESELEHLTTNRTNRLLMATPQKFLRLSTTKRNEHLVELVRKELQNKARKRICMIFSHRTTTAVFVSKFLRENNIECELLTKSTPDRDKIVERFFKKEIQVLVCTDLASRGWDTTHVSHVINFEMPVFISDYLHRIGRVGRLGSVDGCKVTNYVTKAYEVDLVKNIEKSIRLDQDLHNINANATRFYKYLNLNKQEE